MSEAPTRHLGDVASFVRGITFKPSDVVSVDSPDSVACMRTKNVQSELDLSDVWGIPDSFVKRPDQYLLTGDLLVSTANSWNLVGKCCTVPQLQWPATFGGFISVLRGDPSQIDERYLYRWFSSPRIQATVRSFGQQTTNISNLNVDRCQRLWLPLPSLAEQQRIAGILDAADALRAKRREALGQLDSLLRSTFLDMFGDPVTNPMGWKTPALSEVTDEIYRYPTYFGIVYEDDGVPEIRGELIGQGGELDSDPRKLRFIAQATSDRFPRTQLTAGDLVMSVRGTIGKVSIVPPELTNANITANLIRISPARSIVDPVFLLHLALGPYFLNQLSKASSSTTIKTIKAPDLKAIPILLPPLDLQRRFATVVESLEQQRTLQRAHLAELDTLFFSLQSRAFRGDL